MTAKEKEKMPVVKKRSRPSTTRTQKIKAAQYDALRDKMKGIEYIGQMNKSMIALNKELTKLQRKKILGDGEKNLIDTRIKIIKEQINLNLRRLKFVLPELKAVEITDPNGNNPFAQLGETIATITKNLVN
jgi:uncharacterized protein YwgA